MWNERPRFRTEGPHPRKALVQWLCPILRGRVHCHMNENHTQGHKVSMTVNICIS